MDRAARRLSLLWLALAALLLSACATAPGPRHDFEGRTVVITGASSGFGKGIALAVAARGGAVVLAARRREALEAVAAEARALGGRALVVPTDVSREEEVARLADAAVAEFGAVDVWINNAGVGALGLYEETPVADHARIIDVNLKGAMYGSHHAVRRFKAQRRGVLINMGSVVGRVPMPYYASYVASKHGVVGLSSALRQELKVQGWRDIHVVTVMPFAADTPWFDSAANYSGRRTRMILMDPPSKIVDAVVHAALHPRPEVAVGWKAKGALVGHRLAPRLSEAMTAAVVHDVQMNDAPTGAPPTSGNLYTPNPANTGVEGGVRRRMAEEDRRGESR